MSKLKILILEYGALTAANNISSTLATSKRYSFELHRSSCLSHSSLPDIDGLAASVDAFSVLLLLPKKPFSLPWLALLAEKRPTIPTLLVVESEDPSIVFELECLGLGEVFTTQVGAASLLPRLWRLAEFAPSNPKLIRIAQRLQEQLRLRQLVGESQAFLAAVSKLPLVASCRAGVLIRGESGTGKELVARAIHYLGPAPRGAFVPVNCGAIPAELVENELFGHCRAAFTGANSDKPGLVDEAADGTLFLDEVDAMPLASQVKLLRFIQEKEYRRLGSSLVHHCNTRVVAATNANVESAVERGSLRSDLYYRLNVISIELPPLRHRREDIPLLARHFLDRYARELGHKPVQLGPGVVEALLAYRWPGNVRELENVIHRTLVLADGAPRVERRNIQLPGQPTESTRESFKLAKARAVDQFEYDFLIEALAAESGNISRAARSVKKDRRAFWELMRKHKIDATRFLPPSGMTA